MGELGEESYWAQEWLFHGRGFRTSARERQLRAFDAIGASGVGGNYAVALVSAQRRFATATRPSDSGSATPIPRQAGSGAGREPRPAALIRTRVADSR
jgi:hypothetical protein